MQNGCLPLQRFWQNIGEKRMSEEQTQSNCTSELCR
jgi:hypothetical protein